MYRAEDNREGMDIDDGVKSAWISLEPEILSSIAKLLSRRDAGAMRLACKTWQKGINQGIHSLAIVSPFTWLSDLA